MSTHSRFAPSAADRWLTCPGSLKAIERLAPGDTAGEPAAQGTVAHWLATESDPRQYLGTTKVQEGFTITIDEEMIEAVQSYNEYCSELGGWQLTEERLSLDPYVPGGYGTSDKIIFVDLPCGLVDIHDVDLKYGQGVRVDAKENPQLMLYALGAYLTYGWMTDGVNRVHIHVHQPRLNHVDTWSCTVAELLAFAERVQGIVEGILSGAHDNTFVAGWHCKDSFCPLRETCRTYADYLVSDFDNLADPVKLTDSEITSYLDRAPQIVAWLAGLKDVIKERITAGIPQPGWKLVDGRGTRILNVEEERLVAIAKLKGHNRDSLYTKPVLLSVAQIEKVFGKKNFPATLQLSPDEDPIDLWTTIPGAPTLARADDKRAEFSKSHGFEVVTD